jgi:hypothetical protein
MVISNAELSADYKAITGEQRPKGDLVIGIRLPSESSDNDTRKEAEKLSDGDVKAFNRQAVILTCAKAICDPNDVTKCHPDFGMPDRQLPLVLTGTALDRVFDFVERLRISLSPMFPQASDAEILQLARRLEDSDSLEGLDPARVTRFRKLARFLLSEIE